MGGLISVLVTLLILALVFYLVIWVVGWIALPEPFAMVIKVVVGIIAIVYLLSMLTGYAAPPGHFWR